MRDAATALFDLIGAIVAHRSVAELMDELATRLQPIAASDFVLVVLHDAGRDLMRLHFLGKAGRQPAIEPPGDMPVEGTVSGHVLRTQEPVLIRSTATETRFAESTRILRARDVASAWFFPLTTPRARLGAIGFASRREGAPAAADEGLLALVAKQVALAVEAALDRERADELKRRLGEERDRLRLLLEASRLVASEIELDALVRAIDAALRRALPHEFIALLLHDDAEGALRLHTVLSDARAGVVKGGALVSLDRSTAGRAFTTREPVHATTPAEIEAFGAETANALRAEEVRSICSVPLVSRGRALGALSVASHRERAFDAAAVERIVDLARLIAPAVDNALAYAKLAERNQRLGKEKVYLEGEIRASFGEIVGESAALARVLAEVASGRGDRLDRADRRRDGHREGAHRARHPPELAAPRSDVREAQLLGDPDRPPRERALRAREGRIHGGRRAEGRALRARAQGDVLPRRGRRHSARAPAQAPPRPPGAGVRAPRLDANDPGGRAPGRGDEPRPRADGGRPPVPERPLLPPQRLPRLTAAAPRALRGRRRPGAALRRPRGRPAEEADRDDPGRCARGVPALLVAGERPSPARAARSAAAREREGRGRRLRHAAIRAGRAAACTRAGAGRPDDDARCRARGDPERRWP